MILPKKGGYVIRELSRKFGLIVRNSFMFLMLIMMLLSACLVAYGIYESFRYNLGSTVLQIVLFVAMVLIFAFLGCLIDACINWSDYPKRTKFRTVLKDSLKKK